MNTEDAKKIAEAIVLCVAAAYGKGKTVGELKQKCVEILTAEPTEPAEKEYRALQGNLARSKAGRGCGTGAAGKAC